MEEPIKKDDLIVNGALASIKKELDALAKSTKEWDESVKLTAKTIQTTMNKETTITIQNLQKLNEAEAKSKKLATDKKTILTNENLLEKERVKLKKQIEAQEVKLQLSRTKENKQLLELQSQRNAENKAIRDGIKAKADSGNAYKRLEQATIAYKNQSKALGAELLELERDGKKNTKAYSDLARTYGEVTKKAQQGDQQLKKLDKTVGDNQRNVGNYKSALGGLKTALGALGIAFGISQIKSFVTGSVDLFRIQEKAVAQVQAGLLSTGNQVGFTLDELKKKAIALQNETLFGDEEILQSVTAQLLTFTNIAGEQFDRTQQAALDLATRLDGDLKSASIQLGKALNDPVKGLSALAKSGIQFSSDQKEMIKTLTEAGKITEAQTLILDELEKQYGGSAAAAAEADGGITQLSNAFNDAREVLGGLIMEGLKPTIMSLKDFFANLDEKKIRAFVNTLGTIIKVIGKLVIGFGIYKATLIAINIQQAIANKGVLGLIKGFFNLKGAADGSNQSTSKLGQTLKAIGWAAIAALAFSVGRAMWDIASGAARARYETDLLAKANARFQGVATKLVDELNSQLEKQIKLIQQRRELGQITAEEEKKQIEDAIALAQKRVSSGEDAIDKQIKQTENVVNQIKEAKKQIEAMTGGSIILSQGQMGSDILNQLGIKIDSEAFNKLSKYEAELEALKATKLLLNQESSKLTDKIGDLNHEFKVQATQTDTTTKSTKETTEAVKDLRIETEKLNSLDASILDKGTEDLSFDALGKLNASFEQELKLYELNLRQQGLTQEQFDAEMLAKQKEVLEKRILLYRQYGINTTDLELELARLSVEKTKEVEDNRVQVIKDASELITEIITANIDKRIEEMDREYQAAQEQQKRLQALADAGNITAEQSLKEERQREIEALKEKQRLEQQKNTINLISSGVSTYLGLIEQGKKPGEALTGTITSMTALKEFLSGFNFFAEGTENAPKGAAFVDEEGAEIITDRYGKVKEIGTNSGPRLVNLSAGDKVKTAEETQKIMQNFSRVRLPKEKTDTAGTSYDLIGKKLDSLIRATKESKSGSWEFDGFMNEMVKRTSSNGDKTTSRYRVKN
jgi:hypothetical protein